MKLKDWADKQGIAYITAYRWFKDGTLPVKAYQTDSGTIIVQDESETSEKNVTSSNQQSSDIMSLFLKKTVEFSKNNASVEDFAAYILSNFSLKLNSGSESPRYSKVKPKSEDIQKHFQQFMKPKGEKPKPNMFMAEGDTLDKLIAESDSMTAQDLVNEISIITGGNNLLNGTNITETITKVPEMQDLIKDLSAALTPVSLNLYSNNEGVKTYDSLSYSEGVVVRNVETTPQSINYTSSTNSIFGSSLSPLDVTSNSVFASGNTSFPSSSFVLSTGFQPTTKEVEKAHQALNKVADELRIVTKSRRGRKPSKKTGKK